jgi:hypothetical protein
MEYFDGSDMSVSSDDDVFSDGFELQWIKVEKVYLLATRCSIGIPKVVIISLVYGLRKVHTKELHNLLYSLG